MNIKLAERNDLVSIVNILDKTTLKLLRKGIEQWSYPWPASIVEEEINQGLVFKMELDNEIVGTFMIKPIHRLNSLHINPISLYVGRIAIIPEYQGKNLGASIINFCRAISQEHKKDMYLDCWAGNNKLKSFYMSCDLDYLGDFPEDGYHISIFQF
ncbi:GNAT family N-acetyltransferase [Psychrobacillus sp. FSL W7-1457]|uniref:GNAT family N-acetyltransferase n=1 Tax=Psychrobacillus sp. FSL W7-1457 TaxID=2954547 RepID=UPI00315B3CAF